MRLNELRKLVTETVRKEQRKSTKRKRNKRNFNGLVESAVRRVLLEDDDLAPGDEGAAEADSDAQAQGGSGDFNAIVKGATQLGKVDVAKAKGLIQLKEKDPNDAISINTNFSKACGALKPTQSSMDIGKATHFALGMIANTMYGSKGPGGNLGAFVCNDYLLDGHHRWVATCMVAPTANVGGFEMTGIEAEDAVRVLNVATAAFQGHNQGKTGEGSFAPFRDSAQILETLKSKDADDVTETKTDPESGETKTSTKTAVPGMNGPGNATKVCEMWAKGESKNASQLSPQKWSADDEFPEMPTGEKALDWASKQIAKNCTTVKGVDDGAVLIKSNTRVDMPVADDPDHGTGAQREPGFDKKGEATKNLVAALDGGGLNIRESIDLKRWGKLAGLIKD